MKKIVEILFISLNILILIFKGFGDIDIYNSSLSILICFAIYKSLRLSNYWLFFSNIIIIILWFVFNSYFLLYGIIALFFFINNDLKPFTFQILIFWLLQLLGFNVLPVYVIFSIFLINLLIWYNGKSIKYELIILCLSIILFEFIDWNKKPNFVIEKYPIAKESYKPGIIFSKITGIPFWDSKDYKKNIIRSYAINTKVKSEISGIAILEHDIFLKNKIVIGENWQQPLSWHNNQLIGNQYYLEAISSDGGLWTNIGSKLKDTCQVMLSYSDGFSSQPLIIKNKNVIYLHDSDYSSSFLANYQKNLLLELTSSKIRPLLIRITNIISCIAIILILFLETNFLIFLSVIVVSLFIFIINQIPSNGDIRLVGKIFDSHENNRFDGAVKSIVDNNFNYIVGDKNCKVLIVKENMKTEWNGEQLVVAEPNAEIIFKGTKMKVGQDPLGNIDNIEDARYWIINNKKFKPLLKEKNVVFIATGSPAKILWKKFLKHR
ncbi:hypothetical protein [Flavobacterium sp.]|jgi:hypothetical protein|uniref:hypothetical protein n=1 Tax=Flavobacterium sp. TaxID=239 RepID=UPI0037BE941A